MKLATQVFLLIVTSVLAAVAAMGAFLAANLERGFVRYINTVQARHLDAIAETATLLAQRIGTLEPLHRDRRLWNRVLRETEGGSVPRDVEEWLAPPRRFAERDPRAPLDERPPPGRFDRMPPPPPRGDALGIGPRFQLLDAQRVPFADQPAAPPGARAPVDREIRVEGRTLGWVRHYPLEAVSRPEELAFLRSQWLEIALVALGLMLAGLVAAPFVARRWSRPLQQIGRVTERIAHGDFRQRAEVRRADEIGALAANVNAMARALSELDESRRRWIAESAHELRTPLMVLRGEIEALQDGVRPLDRKALDSLAEEVRLVTKLVNDLHLLAIADVGRLHCVMARVDLDALVRRCVDRFQARAADRQLAITVDSPQAGVAIEGDADRLEQLFANLLENSVRYTDGPGRIAVSVRRDGAACEVVVEDSAPGLPEADCARVFDPLFRGDPARSRRQGGSGMGLSIAKAIAAAHGARISARPSRLGGLAVTVSFPAA